MNKWLILLIVVVALYVIGTVTNDNTGNPEDKYATDWSPPGDKLGPIAIIMAKNNTGGCGEFHIKQNKDGSSEYLVACSSDGSNWTYYLVWLGSQDILGPLSDTFSKPY